MIKDGGGAAGIDPNSLIHLTGDYLAARQKRVSAAGAERQRLSRIEKTGVNMKAYRLVMELRDKEPKEARVILEQAVQIAQALNLDFAKQGDLFAAVAVQTPNDVAQAALSKALAYEEGFKAGRAGRDPLDNRFAPGTVLHQEFYAAWVDGQRALADEMGVEPPADGERLQPEKKTRGRKKAEEDGVERRDAKPRGRRRRGSTGTALH